MSRRDRGKFAALLEILEIEIFGDDSGRGERGSRVRIDRSNGILRISNFPLYVGVLSQSIYAGTCDLDKYYNIYL